MKTKLIALIIVIILVVFARKGLSEWDLVDVNFGTTARPVILVSMNTDHRVLSSPDFGLVKLALVQARKGEKVGEPMWFIQLPYCKWRPL